MFEILSNRYLTMSLVLKNWAQAVCHIQDLNPYLTNGFSNRYQLGESTFILRGSRSDFELLIHISMNFL